MYSEVITSNDYRKWDEVVRSFPQYEVFYLSEYVSAFAQINKAEPLLYYCTDCGNRAMNVVLKRDISLDEKFQGTISENTYFDLITPYGYGGFLADGILMPAMIAAYEDYCKKSGFVSEFTRFLLNSKYLNVFSGEKTTLTHNVVRSLNLPIDEMLSDFEHKVRKNLKKAMRSNLNVFIENNTNHLDSFINIYYETMNRNSAVKEYYFSEEFFKKICRMTNNFIMVYVALDDKVIASELILYTKESAYSYLGGTLSEYFSLRPNEILKFEAMKWLKAHGVKKFVLGGGYGTDDGIFHYKKSFAPHGIIDFYTGRKVFNGEVYELLVDKRKQMGNFNFTGGFFPEYRG